MTTRHIASGADAGDYTLTYDAENRLTQVNKNGALLSRFYYDGDGRRVKSVTGSESILFVGAHFEASTVGVTTTNTNYYFAGTTRVAMRKYTVPQNATLTYLLSDHLGSTSLTINSVTNEVIETRYKAWGEVRWTTPSKALPTRNTFTGQYSYVADDATDLAGSGFGLMFYNARWYDPSLGRFAQADTIVRGGKNSNAQTVQDVAKNMFAPLTVNYSEQPIINKLNTDNNFIQQHGGSLLKVSEKEKKEAMITDVPLEPQAFDRYSYALNNPMKYSDPTGHDSCGGVDGFGYCYYLNETVITLFWQGLTLSFDLTQYNPKNREDLEVLNAVKAFVEAADDFKDNLDLVPPDLIGFTGTSLAGATAAGACLSLSVACMALAAVGAVLAVGAQVWYFDIRMEKIKAARLKGKENFMFLLDQ